jgi:hypothetical protein
MNGADFRVLLAMVKAGLKRKAKLDPVEHAQRFVRESELQLRRYCNAFALWRRCRRRACRRSRACTGDTHRCLKSALDRLPHAEQLQVRARILAATPQNIGAPERAARQCLPRELYE